MAADVAEGVDERDVGQADVARLHAAADQHPGAPRLGPDGQLLQQPRLADARVAGDQPDRRPALLGPGEHGEEAIELLGTADEDVADAKPHAASMAPARDAGTPPRFRPVARDRRVLPDVTPTG